MIFLSHSWTNKSAAYRVLESLLEEGIPAWIDDQQLQPGAKLLPELLRAISDSAVYLYLVSEAANESAWVREELEYALGRERERHLQVVPVRLTGETCPLPSLLGGRLYHDLDVTRGGARKLASTLRDVPNAAARPAQCNVSAILRLAEHGLVHTVDLTRELVEPSCISVLLLGTDYGSISDAYWQLSEVQVPPPKGPDHEFEQGASIVDGVHEQCRRTVAELRRMVVAYAGRAPSSRHYGYFSYGFRRAARVLLHRLNWNVGYLQHLSGQHAGDDAFLAKREIPSPFSGHVCEFVEESDGKVSWVGKVSVPAHGHPYAGDIVGPWGMTDPLQDLLETEVGEALGHLVGHRFLAKTLASADLPEPSRLRYGLG